MYSPPPEPGQGSYLQRPKSPAPMLATAQATSLQVLANATFPAAFSQAASDREEGLSDFYFVSKKDEVQANVVMICSIMH